MKKLFSLILFIVMSISGLYGGTIKTFAEEGIGPQIMAKSAYLMDYNTGAVIYEQDSERHLPIASMVKIMTLLLTYEHIDKGMLSLNQEILVSENAAGMGGSQVFLDANAIYKLEDLLKGVIVASANDASVALAETISGSEESFVVLMNQKATELGMTNTNFANCSGLPAANQYSCVKDVSLVMKSLLKHSHYFTLSKIWLQDLVHPSGRKTELANTNKLVRYYKGCDAGKTGSTNEAGYCVSASAIKGNMRLIATVAGSSNSKERFASASNLFNYGFANYENKIIIEALSPLKDKPRVSGSKIKEIAVASEQSYYALSKKGEQSEFTINYEINNKIKAPIKVGQSVGKIIVIKNGTVVFETSIIALENADKQSFFDTIKEIFGA
ncbi:MAG: D-alanyl-D-alanine carboxypeptidase family protein [Clostridia bacterium]|jgi:D-alanyl-D-alanine carboxypeptidase (penicillin-binding protein 5/6)